MNVLDDIFREIKDAKDERSLAIALSKLASINCKPCPEYACIIAHLTSSTVFDAAGNALLEFQRVVSQQPLVLAALVEQLLVLNTVQGLKADPRALSRAETVAETIGSSLSRPQTLVHAWFSEPKEAASLFCGSKVQSAAAATPAGRQSWIGDLKQYVSWLGNQLSEFDEIPADLLDKALKLGHQRTLLTALYARNAQAAIRAHQQLKPLARAFALRQTLQWAQDNGNSPAIAALWKALEPTPSHTTSKPALALASDPLFSTNVQRAAALYYPKSQIVQEMCRQINSWGSATHISSCLVAQHHAETQTLLSCVLQLNSEQAVAVLHGPECTLAVTNHLSHNNARVRAMGTAVAEALGRRGGEKLRFEINHEQENWILVKDEEITLEQALDQLIHSNKTISNSQSDPVPEMEGLIKGINEDKEEKNNEPKMQFDSDDEEEPEEINPPLFVRELLPLLAATDSFPKINAALTFGPSLLRRKAHFGSEVEASAQEILTSTIALGDSFAMPQFSERRQALLTAIVVSCPTEAPTVVRLAAGGDYSLSQRMALLNTLVLAAKELAEGILPQFPSSKLPANVASALAFANDIDKIAGRLQDQLVVQTRDDAMERAAQSSDDQNQNAFSAAGKVLRVSRALEIKREQQLQKTTDPNRRTNFSKIAGPLFFFPLVAAGGKGAFAWTGGYNAQYSEMLYGAWVRTLAILVHYAAPCNDLGEMVAEFVEIWLQGRSYSAQATTALDALYTSILIVANEAGALMVEQHAQKLSLVAEWISQTWKAVPDDRVQKLGAAALLRLEEQRERLLEKLLPSA